MTAADALRQLLADVRAARANPPDPRTPLFPMGLTDAVDYLERLALDGLAGEAPINQCDGCRAGHPLRGGRHIPEGSQPFDGTRMVCTKDRYTKPTEEGQP